MANCSKDPASRRIKVLAWWLGLTLVPLLLTLAGWQWQRGVDKAERLAAVASAEVHYQLPVQRPNRPQRIELRGALLPDRYFLLDNRTHQGRAGYEVLGVLAVEGEAVYLLVNLGWIPAPALRSQLPAVRLPTERGAYRGWLVAAEPGFRLEAPEARRMNAWPQRVQQADWRTLSAQLGVALYPGLLRAEQPYLSGAAIAWQPVNMPPEKHYAYALQWLGMALMTALWLWWWARREGRHSGGQDG